MFVNAARNRMKILHREEGGFVLYALRIEMGTMRMPFSGEPDEIARYIILGMLRMILRFFVRM